MNLLILCIHKLLDPLSLNSLQDGGVIKDD